MATMTPLGQQITSPPWFGRTETGLHWGAAVGALLIPAAWTADLVAYSLWEQLSVEALNRIDAITVLTAATGAVVAATCIHLDTAPPRRMSGLALGVAALAGMAGTPSWLVLATGEVPFFIPAPTGPLLVLWMVLAGVAALVERSWHWWLSSLTVLAGLASAFGMLGVGIVDWALPLVTGALVVWAGVFAVSQAVNPHPADRRDRQRRPHTRASGVAPLRSRPMP